MNTELNKRLEALTSVHGQLQAAVDRYIAKILPQMEASPYCFIECEVYDDDDEDSNTICRSDEEKLKLTFGAYGLVLDDYYNGMYMVSFRLWYRW